MIARTRTGRALLIAACGLAVAGPVAARSAECADDSDRAGAPLPMAVHGRVVERQAADGTPEYVRQWPGSYFEAAFTGTGVSIRIGPGAAHYRISLDGAHWRDLETPAPGLYPVAGLAPGRHVVRVDVISESQSGPTTFGGFVAAPGTRPAPLGRRARQIEIVGDSHSVGYGNRSAMTDCTDAQVFQSTDAAQSPGAELARHYEADYRIEAISGRGVVRNYNGFEADTLPDAYPFALLNHDRRYRDPAWDPRLVVISLGTNDFSTALHAGERWADRAALHADFERRYAAFVRDLRARYAKAFIILWATDLANCEIAAEAARVAAGLRADGDRRIAFVPVRDLAFSACHGHPGLADDRAIAAALAREVDAHPDIWR